ncbi:hypothetical protein OGAPHI_003110 [Ogataea philodendri]|uniref:Methylthioribose-1-phosphate isomerase n=1 Tax=Ogataea philodendri TaxID=1378263 RepID=A0A9P8T705_9ASCO|nr:uncharacterized protein OGAPHI_003110 [Ogataea philodendri]KAH3667461.1 hypothetical protein OGAPHI_003110 [Ogataea philodendri]
MSLEAIKFDEKRATLRILNQLLVPYETQYLAVDAIAPVEGIDLFSGYTAIKGMYTRGAPAIMLVGCFSVVVELNRVLNENETRFGYDVADLARFKSRLLDRISVLIQSRPTAVNLLNGCNEMRQIIDASTSTTSLYTDLLQFAVKLYKDDLKSNHAIGANGVEYIYSELEKEGFTGEFSVMTICNTGSLATSGYGTALGIIRALHQEAQHRATKMAHVYACETRPYNQGSRLTAYELQYEKIPFSLITDNMVSFLVDSLAKNKANRSLPSAAPIKFIIVGADRIVKNGDLANKIGTFQLSLIASLYPSIKFIGAAPTTTIDFTRSTGDEIVIEQRPKKELTQIMGGVVGPDGAFVHGNNGVQMQKISMAPVGIDVWNPSFDVTPHDKIDAIVTEKKFFTKTNGSYTFE